MGKRKERRLAATGRRVKLDLFAEPAGDLGGGSSDQDEVVGGEDDSKSRAGLTNSPSSSGQKPENPLMLLEQYSDDELDEESSKSLNNVIVENFLADLDDQAKVAAGKECEEKGVDNHASQKVEQHRVENVSASQDTLHKLEGNGIRENDATEVVDSKREFENPEQVSDAVTSDTQVGGDVDSGWKLVLHEESSKYYYWNTLTGETSWDVPHCLIHKTDDPAAEGESAFLAMEVEVGDAIASLPTDGTRVQIQNFDMKEKSQDRPETEMGDDGHGYDMPDTENSVQKKQSADAALVNGGAASVDHGKHETESNHSSSIMKQGEYLLEKLLVLKSSEGYFQAQNRISNHILEVELRLHDITSLSSYGSSLLPFWLHSQRKLKQLEVSVNELLESVVLEKTNHVGAKQKPQQNVSDDIRADTTEKRRTLSVSENSQALDSNVEVSNVPKDSHDEEYVEAVAHANRSASAEYPNQHAMGNDEVGVLAQLSTTTVIQPEEDMDMDVEMEVEDENLVSSTITSNQLGIQNSFPPEQPSSPPPPPPDDEWIPPPPPDNELFPPPPPDEPPESTYPSAPSEPETVQTFSYADHYNLTYPVSTYEYYAQTGTIPGSGVYSVSDGHQLAPPVPIFYGALPNTYSSVPTTVVNPVETVSYYGLQDQAVPPLPMVSSGESSTHVSHAPTELVSTSLPLTNVGNLGGGAETSATISVTQGVSVSSTPIVAATSVASTQSVSKVQSKARMKKKTAAVVSSLRSNKKVSSLVDKWKAAKDELHKEDEDEDDPENAYEILEKKRRREIEEWRAQQIASGEAKDNANFQPLGGDWRERVKRRRAQIMKDAVEDTRSVEEVASDAKQQPDLNEVSRGLPSGWQAYWDESSKMLYYANSVTSETTWIRPTS